MAWSASSGTRTHANKASSCIPLHLHLGLGVSFLRVLQERQQQGKNRKEALQQAVLSGQRLVIDLDFEDCMSDTELKSLCKQLVYCWSANLKVHTSCCDRAGAGTRQSKQTGMHRGLEACTLVLLH